MTLRTRLFDPPLTPPPAPRGAVGPILGDRRDGAAYVYTPDVLLAVNVALATGRPLLVRGPSGAGKSSLATSAARHLGWRYLETVVTSKTQAADLLYRVDYLRRLHDAQTVGRTVTADLGPYVVPGVLWWAFAPASAEAQAARNLGHDAGGPADVGSGLAAPDTRRAVVLVDEIDKADPDVPNNLLVPLGSLQFEVDETRQVVQAAPGGAPLVVITTNDERELPNAFLRRCVEVRLRESDAARLAAIGVAHFADADARELHGVAELLETLVGAPPSPAEFLDTVRAMREMSITPRSDEWQSLVRITVARRAERA